VNPRAPGGHIILWAGCLCVALNGFLLLRPNSFEWNLARTLRSPGKIMDALMAIQLPAVILSWSKDLSQYCGSRCLVSVSVHVLM
jgi:hypothetical protein